VESGDFDGCAGLNWAGLGWFMYGLWHANSPGSQVN